MRVDHVSAMIAEMGDAPLDRRQFVVRAAGGVAALDARGVRRRLVDHEHADADRQARRRPRRPRSPRRLPSCPTGARPGVTPNSAGYHARPGGLQRGLRRLAPGRRSSRPATRATFRRPSGGPGQADVSVVSRVGRAQLRRLLDRQRGARHRRRRHGLDLGRPRRRRRRDRRRLAAHRRLREARRPRRHHAGRHLPLGRDRRPRPGRRRRPRRPASSASPPTTSRACA